MKKKMPEADTAAPAPALLGVAIDVSGSMQTSLQNSQMMDLSRLGGVEKGFSALLDDSRRLAQKYGSDADLPLRVFAYAFGLTAAPRYADLLTVLRFAEGLENIPEFKTYMDESIALRRSEAERKGRQMRMNAGGQFGGLAGLARGYGFGNIVDSIERNMEESARRQLTEEAERNVTQDMIDYMQTRIGDTTLDAGELFRMWSAGSGSFDSASRFIFGNTPMRGCLEEVERRFRRERSREGDRAQARILLIVSDGESTDGLPDEVVKRMKDDGITVACAYVTDRNIQSPRELRHTVAAEWPAGARQMFGLASSADPAGEAVYGPGSDAIRAELEKSGWTVPPGARLFVQANHSDTLADFMRIAGTAIPARQLLNRVGRII
ncbi:MAG: VWA domain-containing protein [Tannerella sp.]|nr:VWA domain-containing protein [Tannerella sp.]